MRRDDLLDLNDSLQHPGRVTAVDISTELTDEADLDLVKPIEGYLEAVSTGNLLLVTGKFATRAVVECARCGHAIEHDVEFEVDEQFGVDGVPSSFASQDFAKVSTEEEPYPMFDGNALMVEALLRQDLLIAMPVQPLCSFGWDGPCPEAERRNVVIEAPPNPKFQKLQSLLKPEEE